METKIFVNLPVNDLSRSMDFFKNLGFSFNMEFTDDKAACMIVGKDSFVMLLTKPFFQSFTQKEVADANRTTEVLTALSAESKDRVNEMVERALAIGATEAREAQDEGFMYSRSFHDLDGHIWEIVWMEVE